LGLPTQDEATDFLYTDSIPSASNVTNCLQSYSSQTISSIELSVAAGKFVPEVHDRLFDKKTAERNRQYKEKQTEKTLLFMDRKAEK